MLPVYASALVHYPYSLFVTGKNIDMASKLTAEVGVRYVYSILQVPYRVTIFIPYLV